MSQVQFVNTIGEAFIFGATDSTKPAKRKVTRDAPEEFHRGWRVDGHPPGEMEAAKAAREKDVAEWLALSDTERANRLRSNEREPKPWDEAAWRVTAKLTRIAKPFCIPDAADQCKALAERGGWQDVRITELAKRKA